MASNVASSSFFRFIKYLHVRRVSLLLCVFVLLICGAYIVVRFDEKFNVVLLGDIEVGKTSLLLRFSVRLSLLCCYVFLRSV